MTPRRRRALPASVLRVALAVSVVAVVVACGQAATPGVAPSSGSPSATVAIPGLSAADAAAYERWQLSGPTDYRFTVDVRCFCPVAKPMVVTVRDGQVASVQPEPPEYWSDVVVAVPDLFRLVGKTRGTADVVDVTYDETLGYPTTIAVDRITNAIDDEVTYVVTDFAPLD